MPYNFAADPDSFHTKKLCSRLFFKRSAILEGKRPFCVLSLFFGGGELGATYDDHLGFIGKRVVDFLLVLIQLLSLSVTAETL